MLNHVAEIRLQSRIDNHHRFAKEQSVLRSADIEAVRQRSQVPERHVAFRARQRAAQPCAVHKQQQSVLVADLTQGFQLAQAVYRADFRRLADVKQPREHHMLIRVARADLRHALRNDLSLFRLAGQNLVPRRFQRAGFMHMDVSRRRTDCRLIRTQERGKRNDVCGRSARHHMHLRLRLTAFFPNQLSGAQAVFIQTVAAGMLQIGFKQTLHHQRMRALAVIVSEKGFHFHSSDSFSVPTIMFSSMVML